MRSYCHDGLTCMYCFINYTANKEFLKMHNFVLQTFVCSQQCVCSCILTLCVFCATAMYFNPLYICTCSYILINPLYVPCNYYYFNPLYAHVLTLSHLYFLQQLFNPLYILCNYFNPLYVLWQPYFHGIQLSCHLG